MPLGRLPGRIMANTGLPEEASKISTPDQVRGLEAGGAGVRIEDRQFLLAVHEIVGVVDVESVLTSARFSSREIVG